jgi:hypothetical protein
MAKEPSNKKLALILYGAVALVIAILILAFTRYVKHDRDPGMKEPAPKQGGP